MFGSQVGSSNDLKRIESMASLNELKMGASESSVSPVISTSKNKRLFGNPFAGNFVCNMVNDKKVTFRDLSPKPKPRV